MRTQSRGKSLPGHRSKSVKALSHGVAAFLISLVIVSTAMIGAAWALAASMQARSDIRTAAYAPPSDRWAWPGHDASGMAGEWSSAFEKSAAVSFDLAGTFALFATKESAKAEVPAADPDTTGSIGASSYKLASLDAGVPAKLSAPRTLSAPQTRDDAEATPLPKPRPKLAALTPMQGLGLDNERPVRTAIYDITAKIVHMPNGEKLEAHSGLGAMMDDPRHVHVRARGPTPPNVYNLRMREALFHGVAAIRMLPENEKLMFGRDGILTHSYLRGPSGQSAGCVSFRDYSKFLRAFQRGEVTRIIVVPSLAKSPTFASRGASAL